MDQAEDPPPNGQDLEVDLEVGRKSSSTTPAAEDAATEPVTEVLWEPGLAPRSEEEAVPVLPLGRSERPGRAVRSGRGSPDTGSRTGAGRTETPSPIIHRLVPLGPNLPRLSCSTGGNRE